MQIIAKSNELKIMRMPDGADGTKCIKAEYIGENCSQFTCYLNLEPGEVDYTGYAKTKTGIGMRMHMIRTGTGPRTCIIEPQDDPIAQDYKILMVCLDNRGLPVKNAVNETKRVPHIVFETAHEAAEYEEYLIQTYESEVAENTIRTPPTKTVNKYGKLIMRSSAEHGTGLSSQPTYTIRSWQEGNPIETNFTDEDADIELTDDTTLEDL